MENIKSEFAGCFAEVSIDSASMVLRNVALVGQISKNGRRYTREALQGGAELYNNVRVYLDHPHREDEQRGWRSVRDLAGKIENAHFNGTKVRGDIVLLGNEGGKLTFELANSMPDIAGMSHNAYGKYHRENGEEIVESIERVVSVDVVTEPATNNGFFESILNRGDNGMDIKQIAEELKQGDNFSGQNVLEIEAFCCTDDSDKQLKSSQSAAAIAAELLS